MAFVRQTFHQQKHTNTNIITLIHKPKALANDYNESKQTAQSAAMFTSTQLTIVFTIIIMGAVTTPLIKKLRIPTGVNYEMLSKFDAEEPNKVTGIDRKWIKPFFTKKVYKPRETGMQLETFDEKNGLMSDQNNTQNNENVSDLEAADKINAAREILKDFEPMQGEQTSNENKPTKRKW